MPIYRMILETSSTQFDTGATYPGCDRLTNPAACDPQQFASMNDAVQYAISKAEIPIRVTTVQEVDEILTGVKPVTSSMIITVNTSGGIGGLSTPVLLGGAVLLFMLMRRRG